EPGEIEAALKSHPAVHGALAVAYGAPTPRLGALVTGSAIDVAELLAHAARLLPSQMVPHRLLAIASLPLSANGKLDRKRAAALLAETEPVTSSDRQPPQGEIEQHLADIWTELLGVAEIARTDNFFALGGDSLAAMRLVDLAQRRCGLEVP